MPELDMDYGNFDVHDQLWKMAWKTRHCLLHRMGVVHRIMEARALDVVPGIARKFDGVGKTSVVRALNTIADEEVAHVNSSTHWFNSGCEVQGKDPEEIFFGLIQHYFQGKLHGPFNHEVRKSAGFTERELAFILNSHANCNDACELIYKLLQNQPCAKILQSIMFTMKVMKSMKKTT